VVARRTLAASVFVLTEINADLAIISRLLRGIPVSALSLLRLIAF
jgi:hypothetical protein